MRKFFNNTLKVLAGLLMIWVLVMVMYSESFAYRIGRFFVNQGVPGLPAGNLVLDDARVAMGMKLGQLHRTGLAIRLNNTVYSLRGDQMDISRDVDKWTRGQFYDRERIMEEIALIAFAVEQPVKDVRLRIRGREVDILTDTLAGRGVNQAQALEKVEENLSKLELDPIVLDADIIEPTVLYESAVQAKKQAEQMMADQIIFRLNDQRYEIEPETIGSWILSEPEGAFLKVILDQLKISEYVAKLAQKINIKSEPPSLNIANGKVTSFSLPKEGRVIDESAAVEGIIRMLEQRRDSQAFTNEFYLAYRMESFYQDPLMAPEDMGVVELIGKATTSFKGSPANRKSNIKNGVKFLNGLLVKPGEEFSTIKAIGRINNASGYLPELVIKGSRTVPEYGGGLCQVSTTLFRAVLNSGLPVTSRRSHSYSVSYYENDGDGNLIGPGLDATIYSPSPDFKFVNDTGATILIWGYVKDDKVTFEIYGTKDGRSAELVGPIKHTDVSPGKAIYVETDKLAKGVIRLLEKPHRGSTATAIYRVRYADGRQAEQKFESYYRAWPARYLIGAEVKEETEKDL